MNSLIKIQDKIDDLISQELKKYQDHKISFDEKEGYEKGLADISNFIFNLQK